MSNAIVPLQAFPICSFLNPEDRLAGVVTNVCILRASVRWMFPGSKCVGLQSVLTSRGGPGTLSLRSFPSKGGDALKGHSGNWNLTLPGPERGSKPSVRSTSSSSPATRASTAVFERGLCRSSDTLSVCITSWIRTMIFFSNFDGLMDLKCEAEKVTKIRTISEHFDPHWEYGYLI